jgi:dienelactone hydrolase
MPRMRKIIASLAVLSALFAASAAEETRPGEDSAEDALAKLSPHVFPADEREAARGMLGRWCRAQISSTNAASTAVWNQIASREDWERFRQEKLAALAQSLSREPFEPGQPKVLVTGTIPGEGFRIENLVIQPAGRLPITANLYVPDPPRESMPGIVISHSHHNPKHEGELQDMGMTWARAGCMVIVPNHLGHGERRQHPFVTAADYAKEFAVGRQDYYFRYDTSLQLYLAGESLMGWLAHDLMSCVDVLVARKGMDAERIILLGAVAGGGDPAAVTAALDERIACCVPFNFGGPQPESRYPLPEDAETSFNYAGSGSWESTRNLARSAADGFLPWVIVGSIAPRKLIHAHEFSWDRERDPVWRRYQKIWGWYDAADGLAFAHGHGTLTSKEPPGSHCNNIGTVHRRQIHEAFRNWFAIDVKPEDEYRNRRPREELTCLTATARKELQPKLLHELLDERVGASLTAARAARDKLTPSERRGQMQAIWTRSLGDSEPAADFEVRPGAPHVEKIGGIAVTREILETEPGISVPMLTLSRARDDGQNKRWRIAILGVAWDGIESVLERRREEIASALEINAVVALVDLRGQGATSPGSDRGQQAALAAHSATHLMADRTLLGGQLRDLRTAWRHLKRRPDVYTGDAAFVVGGSAVEPLPADSEFKFPRRVDGRPAECQPSGALLASLVCLYEDDLGSVSANHGLVSYRSLLASPFVQIPHECLAPGLLLEVDLPDLAAALAPNHQAHEVLVDGRGRRLTEAAIESEFTIAKRAYAEAKAADELQLFAEPEE